MHTDQKYITALLNHDEKLIGEIYSRFAANMKAYLLSRGCSEEDAGDIFQEAIIDIYKLANDKKFVLTCPIEAFLLLLCKRKFINKTKKATLKVVTNTDDTAYTHVPGDANACAVAYVAQAEKEQIVMLMLTKMGNCKEVILNSLQKKPQEEIAAEMGMTYAYFRKRKSNCMGELAELVRNHSQFKEFDL